LPHWGEQPRVFNFTKKKKDGVLAQVFGGRRLGTGGFGWKGIRKGMDFRRANVQKKKKKFKKKKRLTRKQPQGGRGPGKRRRPFRVYWKEPGFQERSSAKKGTKRTRCTRKNAARDAQHKTEKTQKFAPVRKRE